jgi:hypothetical protein
MQNFLGFLMQEQHEIIYNLDDLVNKENILGYNILENSKKYKNLLFRGVTNYNGIGYIGTPRQRQNLSSENPSVYIYNIWVSTNPKWSKFPNRFKSVFTCNFREYAETYGEELYVIFPQKDIICGIAPQPDMWKSFKNNTILPNIDMQDNFFNILYDYEILFKDWQDIEKYFSLKINEIIKNKKLFNKYFSLIKKNFHQDEINRFLDFIKFVKDGYSVSYILDKLFDPDDNEFEIVKSQNILFNKYLFGPREVWFSGNYIAIKYNVFKKL